MAKTRSLVRSVFLSAVLALAPAMAGAQVRAAVVDMQRALLATDSGRAAQSRLRELFEQRQAELNRRQAAVQRERDLLEQQGPSLNRNERELRTAHLTEQFTSLQRDFASYTAELRTREEELTRQLMASLRELAGELRARHQLEVLFDTAALVAGAMPAGSDLTDELVQLYNQRHPAGRPQGNGATHTP